ncbi:hypothetical protein [Spiroplasma eriocheiris]|uniref:Uncharacterized protein n=1 Tax=Spiroplasma eriocheiris TaxID=315358 RepID=A0A0H3XIN0_9MOLU|nr:hypothetical protein [Spiroplasma eriocheiris]AHF57892.1 hypothetical protein SPE_0770 [Spiroplasma eriocheiris CCTCC M 207170]AKM54335.1 hypothetical protein SERIO_v1c07730 [Spiroplasma eriocheiris]
MKTFGDQQIINAIENKKLKQVVKKLLALRLNYTIIERIVRSKRELNNKEKKFVLSIINHNLHSPTVPKKTGIKVNKLATKTSGKKR